MADYLALIAQRADLDKQIAAVRKEAVKTAWKEIKKVMKTYNLSKGDVFKLLKPVHVVKNPAPIKYRNGTLTWTGRGLKPRFVRQAEENGTLEQFRVYD
jgi:DNA-binding protein H-NS